ncbi:MAG: exocyst complex component Sec5-domain-containing protein [Monoraphidium minutum]|nr:MAG: exocyst complex component Sec5-domain-containing protein [Monoraphidium minutum]
MAQPWEYSQRRGAGGGGGGDEEDDDDLDYMTEEEEDDGGDEPRGLARLTGPATWQEVDRAELADSALALISSIAQTAPTDDKSRDAVWHPTTTVTVTAELVDPLGLGRIDPATLRLERNVREVASPQPRINAAGVNVDTGPDKAKGAVGRFFTEFAARGSGGGAKAGAGHARGSTGGPSGAGRPLEAGPSSRRRTLSAGGKASHLPVNMLLPTLEGFDPEAYLGVFHEATPAGDLAAGLAALERELGERQGQLKTLVKQNFDRFISCKTAIDDIYGKLRRVESAGTGISTQVLFTAVQEVQASARQTFGPLLERHQKAERIKSVQALLRRFHSLFSMPARIRALAVARDYEQVCAEYKKANALIRPSSNNTAKVWARLHTEIEKCVGEVWQQLEGEVGQPDLPAAAAPDLLLHMLALQAEGLPIAQGKDPVGLLLDARDRRIRTELAAANEAHARAMGRLRDRYCQVAGEVTKGWAIATEQQLLAWTGDTGDDGAGDHAPASGSGGGAGGDAPRPGDGGDLGSLLVAPTMGTGGAAGGGPGGGAPLGDGGAGGTLLSGGGLDGPGVRLAPLSGLQPPPLQSRLVAHITETTGEALVLNHISELSSVMLSCLPGFWAAASSSRLADAPDLPLAAKAKLRASLKTVTTTAQMLVDTYCREVQQMGSMLVAVGPLRNATSAIVQPGARGGVAARAAGPGRRGGVCGGRAGLPPGGGGAPAGGTPGGAARGAGGARGLGGVPHTQPRGLARHTPAGAAAGGEEYAPGGARGRGRAKGGGGEGGGSGGGKGGSPKRSPTAKGRPGGGGAAFDSDDDGGDGGGGARGGVGVGGVAGVSDDVRLLLAGSNLSYIRSRLMGSLTQRFLLVLTGENVSELERVSRTVKGLAKRMDTALQVMFDAYRNRKRAMLDRLMDGYVRPDGGPAGAPPELRDITPGMAGLLQALAAVQAEAYTYARVHTHYLLPPMLEHVASGLASRYAALPPGSAPPESLGQYFLDLTWLDGVASAGGPPSMRVDIDAGYSLLAGRIAGCEPGPFTTGLGRSLAAVRDPAELNRKLQVTCRKLLPDILGRSTFTVRSFMPV